MAKRSMTQTEVLELLRKKQGGRMQKELAEEIGISDAYLSDIFNERREPGDRILDWLGLEKRIEYQEKSA